MTFQANLSTLDFLLMEVAERIQLSRTAYLAAQDRYRAVSEYVSGPNSPIADLNPYIYPQGSFRIQSTISSRVDGDEYDIDLVLELDIDPFLDPGEALQMVFAALDRGEGSRYHDKCEIKRRCVTIYYSDMHLDLTPAVLLDTGTPRVVSIFDGHPQRKDHWVANPEGFARHFENAILPRQLLEVRKAAFEAAAEPVPDQEPLEAKPPRLLALQLLKRYRDVRHGQHGYAKMPSVLLAKLVADAIHVRESSLHATLVDLIDYLVRRLSAQVPLHEVNPACKEDVFTDRWPGPEGKAQTRMVEDLQFLKGRLDDLTRNTRLDQFKDRLSQLFGERASGAALQSLEEHMQKNLGAGRGLGVSGSLGGLVINPQPGNNTVIIPRPHRHYGVE